MAEFFTHTLQQYLEAYSSSEPAHLKVIREQTDTEVHNPKMLSGHYQGRLLSMISKLLRPRLIVEIGTYTGYSALCLAEGLTEEGMLITFEKNADLADRIKRNFSTVPLGEKISLNIGDAHELLPQMDLHPDLVFIDGDKRGYASYYDLLIPRMTSGSCLLVDNVLWSGKVLDPDMDKKTAALHQFNQQVAADQRVDQIMLPIRDGITLIMKK